MISINRLPEPAILEAKKSEWDQAFAERRAKDPKAKAWSSQYGHRDVVSRLQAMSHHKCFYCEQSVKSRWQIDHYIEVAECPERAHEWRNLYLSCPDCNGKKIDNRAIPVTECIDPCDPSVRPDDHLKFDRELIKAKNNSKIGDQTIRKYALGRKELDSERRGLLVNFLEAYSQIQSNMIQDNRKTMRDDELELLRSFAQPDAPFSLMFCAYLPLLGL